jgi:hypothetical protein
MMLFENQDINRGIIHSRYGTGAETWKKYRNYGAHDYRNHKSNN